MTKATTRKAPAKKTAAKKTSKAPEPMDDTIEEVPMGEDTTIHAPMAARLARSLETLVAEVMHLYPEVTWEGVTTTSRGVTVSVTFEGWDAESDPTLPALLDLMADPALNEDRRVSEVLIGGQTDEAWAHVSVYPSLRTMDDTSPFGLNEAYLILAGKDGS